MGVLGRTVVIDLAYALLSTAWPGRSSRPSSATCATLGLQQITVNLIVDGILLLTD